MSLPPGSRLPSLVQVGRWIVHPLRLLDECQRRYGDVFTWRAPRGKLFVIVADPDLIKQVLTEDAETLLAGASNAPMLEPILGKQSLLMLDGAEHLRQRRLLLPSFHGAQIQAFATAMREITAASLASWPMHRPFALHTFMQDITLEVILRTVFGVSAGPVHDRLRTALIQLLDLSDNQWLLLPGMLGVDPFRIPWLRMTKLKR
ncbi:MAG: cytochrome P450, partial [Kofleriaceae bacterium]